jgi:hypothetical protein
VSGRLREWSCGPRQHIELFCLLLWLFAMKTDLSAREFLPIEAGRWTEAGRAVHHHSVALSSLVLACHFDTGAATMSSAIVLLPASLDSSSPHVPLVAAIAP